MADAVLMADWASLDGISGPCEAVGFCTALTSDLRSCSSGVDKKIEIKTMIADERRRKRFIYIYRIYTVYETGVDGQRKHENCLFDGLQRESCERNCHSTQS